MGAFHFQVDRIHRVLEPIVFNLSLAPSAQTRTLEPGQQIVYRGTVELANQVHLVFDQAEKRLYTSHVDRVRQCLMQDTEALPHYG